jgi:hypothetical protein
MVRLINIRAWLLSPARDTPQVRLSTTQLGLASRGSSGSGFNAYFST